MNHITTQTITKRLLAELAPRSMAIMPNVVIDDWAECDVAQITMSGYLVEYEIKVSRSDYKADFQKKCLRYKVLKHDQLESGQCIPNRFYFATPKGLIDSVPQYAGWYEISKGEHGVGLELVKRKNAPELHKKPNTALAPDLFRKGCFRYINHVAY